MILTDVVTKRSVIEINLLTLRCFYISNLSDNPKRERERQSDGDGRSTARSEAESLYNGRWPSPLLGGPDSRSPSAGVIQRDDIINNQSVNRDGPSVVT